MAPANPQIVRPLAPAAARRSILRPSASFRDLKSPSPQDIIPYA